MPSTPPDRHRVNASTSTGSLVSVSVCVQMAVNSTLEMYASVGALDGEPKVGVEVLRMEGEAGGGG